MRLCFAPMRFLLFALLLTACSTSPTEPEVVNTADSAMTVLRSHYPDGQVESEVPVVEGLQHGALVAYHPDGTVKARQGWSRGRPVGEHKVYTPDGVLRFHALSTYEDHAEAQFLAYSVLLNDSTVRVTTANRLVITDTAALLAAVRVEPAGPLRFGQDNPLRIHIPNVPSFIPSVRHGILGKDGAAEGWWVRPTVRGQDVELRVSAAVNDTVFDFDPVVLPVAR